MAEIRLLMAVKNTSTPLELFNDLHGPENKGFIASFSVSPQLQGGTFWEVHCVFILLEINTDEVHIEMEIFVHCRIYVVNLI